ncbi:SpvB/TcaC N-terminal domain-containing protein [Aquimarina hainanensis]|uniref:SpvB/TcaC N-terminal domain-containing protein n=1 Tax=Aquimarina hainanensis TaxID=1578017 RepID=A0ABW5N6X1_9FLAO
MKTPSIKLYTYTQGVFVVLQVVILLATFLFTTKTFAQEQVLKTETRHVETNNISISESTVDTEIQEISELDTIESISKTIEPVLTKKQQKQLKKLDKQLKKGKITQEEYDKKKAEITGIQPEEPIEPEPEMAMMARSANIEPEAQTLGKYIAPQVSTTNGSLNYEYPVVVPTGRNGLTPDISLNYNSGNKSHSSLIGTGWSFNIPYIQRINKKGTNNLYTENHFTSSLDGELIDQGNGIYTPRTENGNFLKYEFSNDIWTITDKEGTVYKLGETVQARQDNPSDTTKIFSWMLESVTDTNGNTISYSYFKDQGQIYPDIISYNQEGLYEVVFNRVAKTSPSTSYASAFKVATAHHINNVEVKTDGQTTAEYDITIVDNLVKDIQVTGYNGTSSFELPEMELGYTHENTISGFVDDTNFNLPTDSNGKVVNLRTNSQGGSFFQDINGDSLPDIVRWYIYGDNNYSTSDYGNNVFINTGNGFVEDTTFSLPTESNGRVLKLGEQKTYGGTYFQDINGDGLPDFIRWSKLGDNNYSTSDYGNNVFINTGNGFVEDTTFSLPTESNGRVLKLGEQKTYGGTYFQDINGDGLPDFIRWSKRGDNNYSTSDYGNNVFINTAKDFSNLKTLKNSQGGETEFTYTYARIQDSSNHVHFPVSVVESVTTDDNNGNVATTNYEYKGADYYYNTPHDKRFAGFSEVIKTDNDGTKTTTKYHQANGETGNEPSDSYAKIGKVFEQTVEDSSGDLFTKTRTGYTENSLGNNAHSIQAASVLTQQFDGDSSSTDTAATYEYDTYGNIEKQIQYGEVNGNADGTFSDTGLDKRTLEYSYVNNTTDYIVGLPTNQTLKNNSNVKEAETNYSYDANGNLLTESKWISGSDYSDTSYTYNSFGLPLTETDALSNTTTYSYDAHNIYPVSVTNAKGHITNYEYDYSSGKLSKETNPNGKVTDYSYDGLDRLTKIEQTIANGGTETVKEIEYNTNASPQFTKETTYRDSGDTQDIFNYTDGLGRTIQTKSEMDSGWLTLDTVYDEMGRVAKQSLPYQTSSSSDSSPISNSDLLTEFTYDTLSRVLETENAKGTTTTSYDGFETTITDAENNQKDLITDAFGNLVSVKEHSDGSIYETEYNYNTQNLLTKITDAENNVRNISYDGLGRRTQLEDLHSSDDSQFGVWNFNYDDINLTSQTDPKGTTTSYTYDQLNRVLTENNSSTIGVDVTNTYDSCINGIGQLCSVVTPDAATNYTYLKQGLVDTESKVIDGVSYTTDTDYDRQGSVTKVTHPNASFTEYSYNTRGLTDEVKWGGTSLVTAEYGVHGRPTSLTHSNGVTSTLTYDEDNLYELTNKTTELGNTKFQDLSYSYDNVGNITQIVDASNTDTAKTQSFTYDDLYRLTETNVTNSANTADYTRTYTYSPIGNINSFNGVNYTYTDTGYSNPHAVTDIGGTSYSYDNNGNLTNDGVWNHTWDYRNRLTSSADGTATSNYEYDHNNDRIKLVEGSDTTIYPTSDYEIKNGEVKVSLNLADTLVATVKDTGSTSGTGSTLNHVHTDHLGGTHITTDSTGVITQTLDYYPFGDTRIDVGSDNEAKQFTGYIKDSNTQLSYAGARYMKSDIGRFISQDPVALSLGNWKAIQEKTNGDIKTYLSNPQKHNSYSYAFNNPVKYQDEGGEWAGIDDAIALGAGFIGGVAAQGVSDIVAGELSSTNSYIASGVGGAVTAEVALYTVPTGVALAGPWGGLGGLGVAGAAGGVADYSVQTELDGTEYSSSDAASEAISQAITTAAFGGLIKLPNVKIPGINAGKGSFQAVSNQITTKLNNGTIENVSAGTLGKMLVNEVVSDSSENAAEAVVDGVSRSIKKSENNKNRNSNSSRN